MSLFDEADKGLTAKETNRITPTQNRELERESMDISTFFRTIEDRGLSQKWFPTEKLESSDHYFLAFNVPAESSGFFKGFEVYKISENGEKVYANYNGDSSSKHGNGDFIVCEVDDFGGPDMYNSWFVNGKEFLETYNTKYMQLNTARDFIDRNKFNR